MWNDDVCFNILRCTDILLYGSDVMGGDRKVKTYSRHHGSRVVTVDKGLWDSSEEQQKHLFSLSSESSINSSDSHDFRKTQSTRKNGYSYMTISKPLIQ